MKLEGEKLDKVVIALESKGVTKNCLLCGSVQRSYGEHFIKLRDTSPEYQTIIVACDNCGHYDMFATDLLVPDLD